MVSKVTGDKKWILFITLPLAIIVLMICITMIVAAKHPFIIRLEMDNNSLAAVQSMNYTYSQDSSQCQQCELDLFAEHTAKLKYINYIENSCSRVVSPDTELYTLNPGLNTTDPKLVINTECYKPTICPCAMNTDRPCMLACYEWVNNTGC